jgi:hypothetical protein
MAIKTMGDRLGHNIGNKGVYPWNEATKKKYETTADLQSTILGQNVIIFFKSKKARLDWEQEIKPVPKLKNPDVPVFKGKI